MARGITESDVHTAADEIVAAGDRPTVERIRAHLGTGSPNTVTRWLETWWQALGPRLEAQQRRFADPKGYSRHTCKNHAQDQKKCFLSMR